ncbi:N-acetyl-gamma-glutamyl-phosphate reductase [Cryobacterium sp. TMT1-62]|uniref:N-acetyl-gamma-glutamyl-phosphate reductase n=1 Tax=Cryobacterium sandaracinum TaxID=1259247 RepID=A0ABY2J3V5_9MICO|nr:MULTISPECIES: N-acetyl-gamma-glutamyl-phosphate reductase [Cryobacterium]TFB55664.1 N-acetyl-gamma-glutamyl-phosphate reductase [Cryobacterium sp. Sr3]TFB61539.1 N-acetyl-gamma-glutamyl-phosphate reductase [Cryobacterium sp. Hz7]TFC64797.1 N-acetyl-gamma-glutamyl-phosphate reductase [Cryobacterium sp. TMT2-4]TFC99544.1 N-acetyl-gamma-glutamyl-phosphate reductase [Cryobacterium sandaracinum]TFD35030.1 N-acetyl-gamma-glutamyl-phosphate reductase [Cryobacterium sp. TMT1-62]
MSFSVAVAGASGYAGGELLRLLAGHPDFEVRTVTAHSTAGQRLIDAQPHLRSLAHLTLVDTTPETLAGHDVVFLALPHGASGALTAHLSADTLVVDCGADHRLESESDWAAFYGGDYFGAWTYGVPELPVVGGTQRSRLAGSRRVAAPGCNASTVALALAPGIRAGVIEPEDLAAVLAVGPSGAGKSLTLPNLASEILGSANPYAVGGVHRHIPEIQQSLRWAGASNPTISFTPVIVPMSRGILCTATARLVPGTSGAAVRAAWEATYADEPFVHVLPEGRFPRTGDVLGANTALIGLAVDEAVGRVVTITAVDNLTKGTAGAAIQSANLALGLPETTGLSTNGVAP